MQNGFFYEKQKSTTIFLTNTENFTNHCIVAKFGDENIKRLSHCIYYVYITNYSIYMYVFKKAHLIDR